MDISLSIAAAVRLEGFFMEKFVAHTVDRRVIDSIYEEGYISGYTLSNQVSACFSLVPDQIDL